MLLDKPPQRIVSLVPSMTESLFDLGLGKYLVGISDYCIHPKIEVDKLPKIGGTKNPRIEDIARLHPDLVIANQEENDRPSILALSDLGIPTWLTFPKTVNEAIADLWSLARLYRSETASSILHVLEKMVEYARLAVDDETPFRYFCPIWYENDRDGEPWWMTFNQVTFSNDLLSLFGAKNVFADRKRRYPIEADFGLVPPEPSGDRDERYPRVRLREIISTRPEVILLPDEPYPFGEKEAKQFTEKIQAETDFNPAVLLVEGSLITWPGTRIAKAVVHLAPEFTKLTGGAEGATL